MAIPALRVIREYFASAEIVLLHNAGGDQHSITPKEVLEKSGLFDRAIAYQPGSLGIIRKFSAIRSERFNVVVYLTPSLRSRARMIRDRIFFRACGIRKAVGFRSVLDVTDRRVPLPTVPNEADLLMERLRDLSTELPAPQTGDFALLVPESDVKTADELFTENGLNKNACFAVCPGSKMPAKRWPIERFVDLCRELAVNHKLKPVVFGGREDRDKGDQIIEACGSGLNLAGRCSIHESAAALRLCHFYVGNDTGVMHLAVSVGVKCVGIFSARDYPGKWYPYGTGHEVLRRQIDCEGCMLEECKVRSNECLKSIRTAEVFERCELVLGVPKAPNFNQ